MRLFSKKILLAVSLFILVAETQLATANSTAGVSILWSSVNVQIIDHSGGVDAPQFTWTSQNVNTDTYSFIYNMTDPTAPDYLPSSALGQSKATSTEGLESSADSKPGNGSSSAFGLAEYLGSFTLTGHGFALITANWALSVAGDLGNTNDFATASAYIAGDYSDDSGSRNSAILDLSLSSLLDGSMSKKGTFGFLATTNSGLNGKGALYASTFAEAQSNMSAVPIPTTAWLFCTGLIGLIGLNKRREAFKMI